MAVAIKNLTRRPIPIGSRVFSRVAREILREWEISLVFVTPTKARALNKKLRGKNYVPNVLSYEVSEKSASWRSCEIIICPAIATREASNYQLSTINYILYLFIHGLLHIKGWVHGATMEKCERTLLAKHVSTNSNRHRHRHVPGKDGRRRGAV